jgi:hypothetical protein
MRAGRPAGIRDAPAQFMRHSRPPARTPAERAAALIEVLVAAIRGKPARPVDEDEARACVRRSRAPFDPLLN